MNMYIMHKKCEESCEKALLVLILPKCHTYYQYLEQKICGKNVFTFLIYL